MSSIPVNRSVAAYTATERPAATYPHKLFSYRFQRVVEGSRVLIVHDPLRNLLPGDCLELMETAHGDTPETADSTVMTGRQALARVVRTARAWAGLAHGYTVVEFDLLKVEGV